MPWPQVALTWGGASATLLLLSWTNEQLKLASKGSLPFLVGSFGALATLQFGAHNSPLVQPRNVIGGTTVAAAVAICFGYLAGIGTPGENGENALMPLWVAVALAPATAIAAMARLGLTHPPAGAVALIFISGPPAITHLGWLFLVCPVLIGNLLCCAMAAAINNLSAKRQYPLYY